MPEFITHDNVEALLNAGRIEVAMTSGRWWVIRRNGQTKRWKRDPFRIYIPFKAGMYVYGSITERDFNRQSGLMYNTRGFRIRSAS